MGLYTNDSIFLYRLPYNNQYGNPELLHVKYDSVSSNFIVNDTLRTDDYGCGQLNHLLFTWYFEDDTIQVDLQFTRLPGLGQKEVHDLKLKVFPNPTSGKVSLQLNSRDTYQIKIFDLTGRNLFTKSYKDTDEIELEMPDDPGIYLLEILEPRGIRTIRKIIRE